MWSQTAGSCPSLSASTCVTVGKLIPFSELRFPVLCSRPHHHIHSKYFLRAQQAPGTGLSDTSSPHRVVARWQWGKSGMW